MSASSRRRLRTRIIEWFVIPDPDPQPSRLDLDDHPASREIPALSRDPGHCGETRATLPHASAIRSGAPRAASAAPADRTAADAPGGRRDRS